VGVVEGTLENIAGDGTATHSFPLEPGASTAGDGIMLDALLGREPFAKDARALLDGNSRTALVQIHLPDREKVN
jgi:hypothetical protein